jgi:hypothetical protein
MHCSPRPARRVARSLCRPRGTGDIDRVVGWVGGLPRLDFEGHKGCVSSFTGEKLTESDVHAAIRSAVGHSSINHGFCVVPVWGQPPGYVLIMEWQDRAGAGSDRFVGHVESELHRSTPNTPRSSCPTAWHRCGPGWSRPARSTGWRNGARPEGRPRHR